MAESLIEALAGDFDPTQYRDEYREALRELIEARVQGREVVAPAAPEGEAAVVDLMAALRASVDAAKKARADAAGDDPAAATADGPTGRKTRKRASA